MDSSRFFFVAQLTQPMANLFNFLGITYLIGFSDQYKYIKITQLLLLITILFHAPKWLSKSEKTDWSEFFFSWVRCKTLIYVW